MRTEELPGCAAGSGLGRAMAILFAQEGAKVAVCDFTPLSGESYCYNLVDNPIALDAFKKVMIQNGLWPKDVTNEFIEAIRFNFIPLFKSVTRQTGGNVSRDEFDSWIEKVNSEVLRQLQKD